jgi:flagellar hook-basal body complex protein FliE
LKVGISDNSLIAALKPSYDRSTFSDKEKGKNVSTNFITYLNNALQEVDSLQKQATENAEKLALGDQEYLHNTMIAYEKANLALQLTIEVRNKIVEAYQEIMRIQM